jgi:diguanylate cyclase (GGDEF)-like protein
MTCDTDEMLATALLDSRTRWRDLALLAADLLFETDAAGAFTFVAPDRPLGHDAAALVGTPARALLAEADLADPFDPAAPAHGMRAWLRTAEGGQACLEFTAFRVSGGLRGVARDVTAEERISDVTARTLRRATALVRLLGAAGRSQAQGGDAAGALARLLEGLTPALGCHGAALLEPAEGDWRIAAAAGTPGPLPPVPAFQPAPRCIGGCALVPAGPRLMLAAWRDPPPDDEDLGVLAALGPSMAALESEAARQGELRRAARTDPLTGLLNRRGFAEAMDAGRAVRPEGVLAYLDMDGLKVLNDRHGHAAGDAAIRALAARLAAVAGPGELAARLGGDEFALWLPGCDAEEAAWRCAPLGAPGPLAGFPEAGPAAVAASIGLAPATAAHTAETLIAEADARMYHRKRAKRAA